MQRRQFQSDQLTIDAINEKYTSDLKATAYYIIKDRSKEKIVRKIGKSMHQDTKKKAFSKPTKKRIEQNIALKALSNNDPVFSVIPSENLWSPHATSKEARCNTASNLFQNTKSNHVLRSAQEIKKDDNEKPIARVKSKPETRNESAVPNKTITTSNTNKPRVPLVRIKRSPIPLRVNKEMSSSSNPVQRKASISTPICTTVKVSPPPNPSFSSEIQQSTLMTSFQRSEILKSLKQKGLPPLQPWKPGKIPAYKFTGRLKDLEEMLEIALLETIEDGNSNSIIGNSREIENKKKCNMSLAMGQASAPVSGRSSIYAPLRCKDDDSSNRKVPRRPWTTWNFKTQWPLPL